MGETNWIGVLLSGITGAALTQTITIFLARWNERKDGRITALLLALTLEDYASRCAHIHMENANWDPAMQPPEVQHADVPALSEFSDKTNWRALGVTLSETVLQIRVRVSNASNAIEEDWKHGGYVLAADAAGAQCLELGIAALSAAEDLRRAFWLGAMPVQGSWSLRNYLHTKEAERQAGLLKWRAQMESMQAGLAGN